MTSDETEPGGVFRFAWRATASHVSTYLIAGLLASTMLDYESWWATEWMVNYRPYDSPWVAAGMGLQLSRGLVFAVVLSIGGLLGWGISKLVRLSVLSGMDRLAGAIFGAGRGVLLAALFLLGGQFAGFDNDDWWQRSILIPHLEVVAEWITIMAPQGYEILMPGEEIV